MHKGDTATYHLSLRAIGKNDPQAIGVISPNKCHILSRLNNKSSFKFYLKVSIWLIG